MGDLVKKLKLKEIGQGILVVVGISAAGYVLYIGSEENPEIEKERNLNKYKIELTKKIDIDENGIVSKYEQFRIDSFCGVLNKPANYRLTFEDWKAGYENLQNSLKKE